MKYRTAEVQKERVNNISRKKSQELRQIMGTASQVRFSGWDLDITSSLRPVCLRTQPAENIIFQIYLYWMFFSWKMHKPSHCVCHCDLLEQSWKQNCHSDKVNLKIYSFPVVLLSKQLSAKLPVFNGKEVEYLALSHIGHTAVKSLREDDAG